MNVGLIGNNDGPLRLLRSLRAAGSDAACVGLQNDPSEAVRAAYEETALPPFFSGFGDEDGAEALAAYDVDVLVNAFCNFRFRTLLNRSYDVLNVHLAPLPAYRGRHPVQWALINGESSFGVTIHRMTPGWDDGPILWQAHVDVDAGMSTASLRERLLQAVEDEFGQFLNAYRNGDVEPRPNDDAQATYVARRYPKDSRLTRWDDPARLVRKVMALRSESYPAYVVIGGQTVDVRSAHRGDRTYVGVAAPFVCGTSDGLDVVGSDGQTVCLRDLDPAVPDVQVNDRIDLHR